MIGGSLRRLHCRTLVGHGLPFNDRNGANTRLVRLMARDYSSVVESAAPAEADTEAPPPRRGRKPGSQNKVTGDLREMIMARGRPIELLCDVTRGVKIRIGPQGGPGQPTYTYPSLADRLWAAGKLADKLIGDRKEQQLTGQDGAPLFPAAEADPATNRTLAMAILALLRDSATGDGADETGAGEEPISGGATAEPPMNGEVVGKPTSSIEYPSSDTPAAPSGVAPEVGYECRLGPDTNGAFGRLHARDSAGNEKWGLYSNDGKLWEVHPTRESIEARGKLLAAARRI